MTLSEVRKLLDADVLSGEDMLDTEVLSACGCDLMSDVLAFVKDQSLLLTGLLNPQSIRTAEMMDMRCVIFVRGKRPDCIPPAVCFIPTACGGKEQAVEPLKLNYIVDANDFTSAGAASSDVKKVLKKLGFPSDLIRRVSVCMYEGEINMVIHADGGTAHVEITPREITIVLDDKGPGIPNIELAMQEGYSTADETARNLGFGAGMGLPNMRKYSDTMNIETQVGTGTTVYMTVKNS